jgi:LysR family transcriptional regulator, benzoate and cis,cis-muconate-responsive activator of ben and cat genes
MDLRQLSYFIVVAEERSISRAAALLNLTQPPLTRHIQALEESLNVQLLRRTTWGVDLTEAGQALLEHARSIKQHVERAAHETRQVASDRLGHVDIGVHGSALLRVIPDVLARFSAHHPEVELSLQSEPKAQLLDALRQGRILVFFDRYLSESPDIAVEIVDQEPVLLAIPASNPLAFAQDITIGQLVDERFIEVAGKSLERLALLCRQQGFSPDVRHRTHDQITATLMVSAGLGMTLVPSSMVRMQLPDVVYRPLACEGDLSFLTHCAYRRSETHPMLGEILRAVKEHREARSSV